MEAWRLGKVWFVRVNVRVDVRVNVRGYVRGALGGTRVQQAFGERHGRGTLGDPLPPSLSY